MAKQKKLGPCHLCGVVGELSEEHVPPKKAFNSGSVIVLDREEALQLAPGTKPSTGRIRQGGARAFTLCGQCNNDTGSWYAPEFISFVVRAAEVLRASRGAPKLAHPIRCRPLRVLKQIATMFFSVNEPTFRQQNPELERFVKDKARMGLPQRYGFFVYLNTEGQLRHWGLSARVDTKPWTQRVIEPGRTSHPNVYCSEITFPPMGYVMTLDSPPPDPRLVNINHFANYGYGRFVDLHACLPLLQTHSQLPGDYSELPTPAGN